MSARSARKIEEALRQRGEIDRVELAYITNQTEPEVAAGLSALRNQKRISIDDPGFVALKPGDDPEISPQRKARGIAVADLEPEAERRAHEAAADPAIESFRRDELGGELLAPGGVAGWIERRAGHPTIDRSANGALQAQTLAYVTPDSEWVSRHIATGATLDRLRALSESLATRFGWHAAQATVFVLTGETPSLFPLRVTVTINARRLAGRSGHWQIEEKIAVEGNLADDPEVFRRAVSAARREYGQGRRTAATDAERFAALVAFVDERSATWPELFAGWNTQQRREGRPHWRYSTPDKLRRGYQRASGRT